MLDLIFFVLLLFYFFGQKGTRAADIDEQSRRGKEDWCEVEIIISLQFESCFATHFLIIEFYSFKDIHILQPSPKAILIWYYTVMLGMFTVANSHQDSW